MENHVALVGLALGLFITTNIDGIFVLIGFFSDPRFRLGQVLAGQSLGAAILYGISVAASLVAVVMSPAYVGFMGLIPIAIGARKLSIFFQRRVGTDFDAAAAVTSPGGRGNVITVAAVAIANGGDNISICTPFFASHTGADVALIGVVFTVMTMAWVGVANLLTRNRTLGGPIQRYSQYALPFILVALGFYILFDAGTIHLLRGHVF